MRVLVLVPARGGSRGIPGKNLATVSGVSLVGRAVLTGRRFLAARSLEGTVLVDTDSEEIAAEGRRWGAEVPFLRPPELAADHSPTLDAVLHAAARLAAGGRAHDCVVLLQPTSPLRDVSDVLGCWDAFDPARGSVVAVTEPDHPPEQSLRAAGDGSLDWAFPVAAPGAPRQALPRALRPTGAVYVSTLASLETHRAFIVPGRTLGVVCPRERSLDVDTPLDLELCRALSDRAPVPGFSLAGRAIGDGAPAFVIAEAGVNHDGDVARAHALVDVAADAGADAVKFQTFDPALLVSPRAAMAEYQVKNTGRTRTQAEMLAELVLPRAAHPELLAHARERGLLFLSSPFDEASADFLEELGVPAFKLASGEVTNHPLLRHVARKGRPLLLSTGMSELHEVAAALEAIGEAGAPPVALFQCVTSYPAAVEDSNLRAIRALRGAFRVPTGYSDHTEGLETALAAVALGAALVEKHFTVDRSLPGPDHRASLEPAELRALVRGIRAVEASLGDGVKAPRAVELPLRAVARRSLHVRAALRSGHSLRPEDLVALRPGTGLSPTRLAEIAGRRLRRAVEAGELLEEADLE